MRVVVYLLVGVVALLVALALVVYMLWGGSPWPAAPPRVSEGERWLRVVSLDPSGLTAQYAEGRRAMCRGFELRVLEEGGAKSVLIRGTLFLREGEFTQQPDGRVVMSRPVESAYSEDVYAVSLDGEFRAQGGRGRVGARAPAHAGGGGDGVRPRLLPQVLFIRWRGAAARGKTAGGLPLERFGHSGGESSGWLLSQGGRYVAGFSHTSRRRRFKRPSLMPFAGEDDRIIDGTMYVDVFDGVTGERLARASKGHKESYDFYVFEQAVWFGGRYFAMPLDHWFGVWLVGALPE